MSLTSTVPQVNPNTFEAVWASFQQAREEMREIREMSKETDREFKEMQKEMREMSQETDRKIGKLTNRLGEMVEHLMTPRIYKAFKKYNYKFNSLARDKEYMNYDGKGGTTEVDVWIENGDYALAIEVKLKPNMRDINEHIDRMQKLRIHANLHNDRRKYIGAIAAPVFNDKVKQRAIDSGFYIIEASEDSVTVINDTDFRPREDRKSVV
jgi:hypothetical protein